MTVGPIDCDRTILPGEKGKKAEGRRGKDPGAIVMQGSPNHTVDVALGTSGRRTTTGGRAELALAFCPSPAFCPLATAVVAVP